MRRGLACLFSALLLTGCPPAGPSPATTGTAPAGSSGIVRKAREKPETSSKVEPTKDEWKEDPSFSRAQLAELYLAEQAADEGQRKATLVRHGLADGQGKPIADRVAAYERALKRFASERPDEWSDVVAKASAATSVDKR
jgi:hypothetical protein